VTPGARAGGVDVSVTDWALISDISTKGKAAKAKINRANFKVVGGRRELRRISGELLIRGLSLRLKALVTPIAPKASTAATKTNVFFSIKPP
jgi:hypothetical protein